MARPHHSGMHRTRPYHGIIAREVSAVVVKLRHFSRDEYHRLAETGVLTEDDRVELLEGTIAAMSPIGPYHSGVVDFLAN